MREGFARAHALLRRSVVLYVESLGRGHPAVGLGGAGRHGNGVTRGLTARSREEISSSTASAAMDGHPGVSAHVLGGDEKEEQQPHHPDGTADDREEASSEGGE